MGRIRDKYAKEFKIVAKVVLPGNPLRGQLEDISTAVESASKARLLDRHEDWSKTLHRALKTIKKQFENTEQAFELLEWDKDLDEFRKGILKRAKYRNGRASEAWNATRNLISDLRSDFDG